MNNVTSTFQDGIFHRESLPTTPVTAPPLLYIHGLGDSGLSFEPLLHRADLADRRQILPDLTGCGRSFHGEGGPPTLAGHAETLARFITDIDCGPVTLVGHSMGGVVGLLLAESHPELVRAFFVVEANICADDCTFSGRAIAGGEAHFLNKGYERLAEGIYRGGRNDHALRTYYVGLRLCDRLAYYRNSVELVELSATETIAPRLAALPVPVHVVAGLAVGGLSIRSLELLDDAGLAWTGIEDAGHVPFVHQPERFIEIMLNFLDAATDD